MNFKFTSWVVPDKVVSCWIPKATQMGQLEILAGLVALQTWENILSKTQCIHFVDNDSATACLVKGYSPKVDSCALVGDYWLQVATMALEVYIDRVESKSNVADGPSRMDFSLMKSLRGKWVEPVVSRVGTHHRSQLRCFGAPS